MKIGPLVLENPLILAPMAGITHLPFRKLVKEKGCGLVVTEMVSANGLVHRSKKTEELLGTHRDERPVSAQIFGASPEVMKEAAAIVEDTGADLLDVNLGCSVRKIVRQGAGAALMREPEQLESILKAIRGAVSLPFTVKMRTGWDPTGDQAVTAARIAEDCGVDAVAVHPRTAVQGFGGEADWSIITRVKAAVSIPVIGNGDIQTPGDVLAMREKTGCDGIMIGRTSIGNPWIFAQALDLLEGRPPGEIGLAKRCDTVLTYLDHAVGYFGEGRAMPMMRSRLGWFVKGLPHSSRFRARITRLETRQEAIDRICAYFAELQRGPEN